MRQGFLFLLTALATFSQTSDISGSRIRPHLKFLASDLLEGRSVGTRGGELAASYIAAQFEAAGLKEGASVEFEARIKEYKKGYVNKRIGVNQRKIDYKLSHPTKIKIVGT